MKSFKITLCALLIASLFCGCMNSVHLKDMMVVEGMGIDASDAGVHLTVQTLKTGITSGGEAPQGNMTMNTDQSGKSIVDAVSNLPDNLAKRVFFGQNKIMVFGENLCKNNFKENLDYFLRSPDSRPDVAVCIAKGDAKSVVESKENDSNIPCENIVYLIKNGEKTANSIFVTAGQVINAFTDKTSDVFMPVVKKEDDRDNVSLYGIGLFSDDRLVAVTNADETVGFLLIEGKTQNCIIEFEDEKYGKIGAEIINASSERSTSVKNGIINFNVNIKAEIIINEVENGVITSIDNKSVKRLRNEAQKRIVELCKNAYDVCKKCKSDSFRVGEYTAKDLPEIYAEICDDWRPYYQSSSVDVNVVLKEKKLSDNTQLK